MNRPALLDLTGATLDGTGAIVLQNLVLPDPSLLADAALYLRLTGGGTARDGQILLPPGAELAAEGWMNLFALARWRREARITGLRLRLSGEGPVRIALVPPGGAPPLWEGEVNLAPGGVEIALDALPDPPAPGLVALHLTAGDAPARVASATWLADAGDSAPVRLALAITTFRREAEVAATTTRICAFLDGEAATGGDLGRHARLLVIDNGGTAELAPHPRLARITNRNLGGAGGFARALAEARAGGFSHCLFMDDDAAMPMENLVRTAAFLRLARSPRAAVAGAMISAARPTHIWENGAIFDRFCRPVAGGTDLTDPEAVLAMEQIAEGPRPRGFYGGFWYFAFPVDAVRHDMFPFFVRGDDISFSLANRFDSVTLPGVVSVQEDFGHKESAQTLYLDLRNHLHHHLVQEGMEIGPWRTAGIALHFILRSLVRLHYASAEAQCLAWRDVMEGPAHFERNADMAARRAGIARIATAESWVPLDRTEPEPPPARPPSRALALAMKFTLNGHLLPFFAAFGARRTIALSDRAVIWPFWGAARLRVVDVAGGRAYEVRHDKRRGLGLLVTAAGLAWRWRRAYAGLRSEYRSSYGPMTAPSAWARRFGLAE